VKILLFAVAFVLGAAAQPPCLQIQVVDGEGAVHAPGSRSVKPLTVEVRDETGRPVERAAVSFVLPDSGPGGAFPGGLRTEVEMTNENGRAAIRGLQWNRVPGRFQIRIVALREQARAGMVSFQYIGDPGK
jgi:hypothetical protein